MRFWLVSLILLALSRTTALYGQAGFVYYDVDLLYDTIPSPFYNDDRYTPEGRYRWTDERYRHKVAAIAAVVDSLAQPVVALYGIENEQVARDLSAATQGDYTYLHRTLNSFDGMEFAILYHADRFQPLDARTTDNALVVDALLDRDTVTLLLTTNSHSAESLVEAVRTRHPRRRCILAGRLAGFPARRYGMRDLMAGAAARGHGTRQIKGLWQMRDRIVADTLSGGSDGAVYIRSYLLDEHRLAPRPTFSGNRYRGGHGRNLPIWCQFER